MSTLSRTTYSAINTFRNCPRKHHLRYEQHLAPREKAAQLAFGSTIHRALEIWHDPTDPQRIERVLDYLDSAYPNLAHTPEEKAAWHLARAMALGYAKRYSQEEFYVVALEYEFAGDIRNPDTGARSQTFSMAGKVDGIVRIGEDFYLLEHKTAAALDGNYIEKLWADTQIALYSHYLRELGFPIVGVLYNVLLKSRLQQRTGETEEEFEARRTALAAKNRTGRSTAKRQEPETDLEFQARLSDWYAKPEAFHREKIFLSEDRLAMLRDEVWEVTQQYLDARRRGKWLLNTSHCFAWQRPCEYLPYCRSNGSPLIRDNLYEVRPPHEELETVSNSPEAF